MSYHATESWSETERVFPRSRPRAQVDAPLSIIDSTVGSFAPSEVVLFYDSLSETAYTDILKSALSYTLDAYPQWAGRLCRSEYEPTSLEHTRRYGRLWLRYGYENDPGVDFTIGNTDCRLIDILPSKFGSVQAIKIGNKALVGIDQFVSRKNISTDNLDDSELSSIAIRVTQFIDGGLCMAIKFAHPLADAHCMANFLRDWSAVAKSLSENSKLPLLRPIFEPQLLDSYAAGKITASKVDASLAQRAQSLPCHRYDWWASAVDCPYESKSTKVPPELQQLAGNSVGVRMPWAEWDIAAPVAHYLLHFSGPEITQLWKNASTAESPLSKQDAVLAHMWGLVNRARGMSVDDGVVHLDYSIGLRARTSPRLPDSFVGSPMVIAAISTLGREASLTGSGSNLGKLASLVRQTVSEFTPEAVAAHLHDKAFDDSPTRLWQAFLGKRHLLTTSWIHTGLYDLDFGLGARPRYVEAMMPMLDGLMQVMEAPPLDMGIAHSRHWSNAGVDVHLYLESATMQRLIEDTRLRVLT